MKNRFVLPLGFLLLALCGAGEAAKKQKKLEIITEVNSTPGHTSESDESALYPSHIQSAPDDCSVLAAKGDSLTVHYTVCTSHHTHHALSIYIYIYIYDLTILCITIMQGKLQSNGQVFDSSKRDGREPFTVTLGAGSVIKGIAPLEKCSTFIYNIVTVEEVFDGVYCCRMGGGTSWYV